MIQIKGPNMLGAVRRHDYVDDEVDARRTTRVVVGSSPTVPAVWRRAGEEKGDFEGRFNKRDTEHSMNSFALG